MLGLVHVTLKTGEYLHLAALGLDMEASTFFTLFWLVTGFHFLHVCLGLVMLGWMTLRCLRGAYRQGALSGLESGVLYWHMIDLAWVLLFPLVYVMAPSS
ncbi:MAG: Cytochrome c oxidase subunit 3 [Stenotrophomonas maltophilia]|nr:MAG: Cytochrome c oxidase subunit 3 [Stenotrophomonas maltophilia]